MSGGAPPNVGTGQTGGTGAAGNPNVQQHTTLSGILSLAGFNGPELRIAQGVAWAESTANPDAENPAPCGPGEHAVGLMAICTNHCGTNGLSADRTKCTQQLKDPQTNANVAHAIYVAAGHHFTDWETFTNGAYRKFVGKDTTVVDRSAAAGDPIGTAVDAAGNAVDAALSPLALAAKVISALADPSTWFRIGKGLLGGILIVLGTGAIVYVVANKVNSSPVGQTAKKIATVAAEA